jgi:hypothetical protein
MSADIIPFRSRFDIECEAAIAAALFGDDSARRSSSSNDGGKARLLRRIAMRKAKPLNAQLDAIRCCEMGE